MPEGMEFTEARVRFDPGDELVVRFLKGPLLNDVGDVLKRFNWHSQVTFFLYKAMEQLSGVAQSVWSVSIRSILSGSWIKVHRPHGNSNESKVQGKAGLITNV